MKSLDYTLDKLPGDQLEIPYEKLPLSNPAPILQQPKSEITTNPFIVPSDKYNKFALFDGVIPSPVSNSTSVTSGSTLVNITLPESVTKPSSPTVSVRAPENPSFSVIVQKTSTTFTGILDDIYKKPDNVSWHVYLKDILAKDNRYNYVAILIFFIALYILLVR